MFSASLRMILASDGRSGWAMQPRVCRSENESDSFYGGSWSTIREKWKNIGELSVGRREGKLAPVMKVMGQLEESRC
jgi:hypothetical protein